MKVLILSDTHLGRKNFKIKERERDFESAFSQVIDYALDKKVDVIIHAGDLFDIGRPSIETILFSVKQLKRLSEASIPFFVIAGSHDVSVDGSFLKVLDNIGLLINLSDKRYYKQEEDKITIKGEERKGIFVCGLLGSNSRINEILELLKPETPKNAFKIFLFHHIISDISPLFCTIKKSCLPKGFDLYVSGHWHDSFESEYDNKKILYPGSTESCDLRDMSSKEKGFFVYDTRDNKYEFVKLNNRKSEIIDVKCDGLTPEEVTEKLLSLISKGESKMLFFILKGRLKSGVKSEINRQAVYDQAVKNNYLFCKIYTGMLENPEEAQTIAGKRSISDIEEEFFTNKGLNKEEVLLAQQIIRLFGLSSENNNDEIIKWISGEFRI